MRFTLFALALFAACSDDSMTVDAGPGPDGGGRDDSGIDAGVDARVPDGGTGDTGERPDRGVADESMSFFATSEGSGASGGDFGGLAGADARCQSLAAAAGAGARTWRAYLSTSVIFESGERVDARDRIGGGPWFNARGEMIAADVAALHASGVDPAAILTETGDAVPGAEHDIVTGSQPDGTAYDAFPTNPDAPAPTCGNWTSSSSDSYVWVGHSDAPDGNGWNSAHETTCDPAGLRSTAGSGRIYCFAL